MYSNIFKINQVGSISNAVSIKRQNPFFTKEEGFLKKNKKKLIIYFINIYLYLIDAIQSPHIRLNNMGHDNLSMFKNLLKYRHESKKQVCNSFTYFRGQI